MLVIALLLTGFFAGMAVEAFRVQKRRQAWKNRNRWRRGDDPASVSYLSVNTDVRKYTDAADQLRIVMGAEFSAQPLLNKSEARVFKELDRMVIDCNPGWQVMAQVSLGEVLRCKDREAYSCINSKRVDLLLVDENCRPRHAVEYQGRAHHQSAAAARDAVKKEALRRAGIAYHEVVGGRTTPSELKRLVERLVEKPAMVQESRVYAHGAQSLNVVSLNDTRTYDRSAR